MKFKVLNTILMIVFSLLIATLLNQDRILRVFHNDNVHHAVPISSNKGYLGDDYHYYISANLSLNHLLHDRSDVSSTNNILIAAFISSALINKLASSIIPSSDTAVLISLIVQSWILVVMFMLTIKNLGNLKDFYSINWLVFITFLALILCDNFLINAYFGSMKFWPSLANYPNVLRIVNPQLGWAYGLLYLLNLCNLNFERKISLQFLSLCIMSLFFAFFSPSLCLTMLLATAFSILISQILKSKLYYHYFIIFLFLGISFVFNYIELQHFQLSKIGLELHSGYVNHLSFKPHYLVFVLFLIPLYRYFRDTKLIILASVLLSSILIGVFCESLELGDRLWLRGAGIYVWIIIIITLTTWVKSVRFLNKISIPLLGFFAVCIWSYYLLPHNTRSEYGFIETDKWKVVDWINRNLDKNSVIISNDLEFSFLLPIYTQTQPYVSLFALSSLSIKESVEKYFYALKFMGNVNDILQQSMQMTESTYLNSVTKLIAGQKLNDGEYQLITFYGYILYYPYTRLTTGVFANNESQTQFNKLLIQWSKNDTYIDKKFDYIILRYDEPAFKKLTELNPILFKSGPYVILKNITFRSSYNLPNSQI